MPRSDQKFGSIPSLYCNLDLQPEPGVAIIGRGRGKGPFFGSPAQIMEVEISAASLGEEGWLVGERIFDVLLRASGRPGGASANCKYPEL